MVARPSLRDAVKSAQQQLSAAATAEEIAAFVEQTFGLKIQTAIVKVLMASLREREVLDQSRARALEAIEKARAEEAVSGQAGEKKRQRKVSARRGTDTEKSTEGGPR